MLRFLAAPGLEKLWTPQRAVLCTALWKGNTAWLVCIAWEETGPARPSSLANGPGHRLPPADRDRSCSTMMDWVWPRSHINSFKFLRFAWPPVPADPCCWLPRCRPVSSRTRCLNRTRRRVDAQESSPARRRNGHGVLAGSCGRKASACCGTSLSHANRVSGRAFAAHRETDFETSETKGPKSASGRSSFPF